MSAYCVGCGQAIPEGQGSSCSMCYGDIAHGRDGFYEQAMRQAEEEAASRAAMEREAEAAREEP